MKTAKIKIVEGGTAPFKKHPTDSCWDLTIRKIEHLSNSVVKVYLGVKIEPPVGYDVRLYTRSSFAKYLWQLGNHVGIGDEGYRGEYIALFNPIPKVVPNFRSIPLEFPYKVGDRCIQMEIRKKDEVGLEIVEEISESDRGEMGFGSTGK